MNRKLSTITICARSKHTIGACLSHNVEISTENGGLATLRLGLGSHKTAVIHRKTKAMKYLLPGKARTGSRLEKYQMHKRPIFGLF